MTREQLNDLITDTAAELFSALCEGDGEHSEALDRGIIEARLRAFAALAAPVAADPLGQEWVTKVTSDPTPDLAVHGGAVAAEPITREWCEAAARAEETAGDPDPTTGRPFNPDWDMLEATRASLREHMAMLKGYNALVALVQEWQAATVAYRAAGEAFQDAVDRKAAVAAADRVATVAYYRMTASEDALLAWTPAQTEPAAPPEMSAESLAVLADDTSRTWPATLSTPETKSPFVIWRQISRA